MEKKRGDDARVEEGFNWQKGMTDEAAMGGRGRDDLVALFCILI